MWREISVRLGLGGKYGVYHKTVLQSCNLWYYLDIFHQLEGILGDRRKKFAKRLSEFYRDLQWPGQDLDWHLFSLSPQPSICPGGGNHGQQNIRLRFGHQVKNLLYSLNYSPGGLDYQYTAYYDILEYLPASKTFTNVGKLYRARSYHAVSAVVGFDHLCT